MNVVDYFEIFGDTMQILSLKLRQFRSTVCYNPRDFERQNDQYGLPTYRPLTGSWLDEISYTIFTMQHLAYCSYYYQRNSAWCILISINYNLRKTDISFHPMFYKLIKSNAFSYFKPPYNVLTTLQAIMHRLASYEIAASRLIAYIRNRTISFSCHDL